MGFTEQDKLKALAIVHIFETSKAFGDYAACVVLNDGAGISYGINQFTHRSGSLAAVVFLYLNSGGKAGRAELSSRWTDLQRRTPFAVRKLSVDEDFKTALRAAAATPEMHRAQRQIAFEQYLYPALQICEARGFSHALSLAVVYDSVTHGSWERISARVARGLSEKDWVTSYIRKRHLWLTNVPRLASTNYRTKFFLDQIAAGNWELRLPVNVHGYRLASVGEEEQAIRVGTDQHILKTAERAMGVAGEKFDSVEAAVTGVAARADAAKSLWTTVVGTLWQAAWAVFGFFAGLPREVWIVVSVAAGLLMLAYLYRQIELGKIRERAAVNAGR